MNRSIVLTFGGILSLVASFLHIAIIIGGAEWYRFFGAGEEMALMAENGSIIPALVTFSIALILFIWACYAFSGAGLMRKLPMLKIALVTISTIYMIRGVAFIPAYFFQPDSVDNFLIWSSIICILYGVVYVLGTKQVWSYIGTND